jgi:hypothetical protein
MRISNLLLLSLALLAGCSRGGREELGAADSATFVADPVTGEADETVSAAAFADIPKERLINFTACLKDVAVQQSVVGVSFRVLNGSQALPMRSKLSDQAGCIRWSENFAFEATAKETFYEIERVIQATSQHQGEIRVRLGINPWQKGAAAVRDLSVRGAPETRKLGEKSNAVDDSVGLLVESVETALDIRGGTSAELRLSFEPKLRRLDISGAAVNQPLTKGAFRVRAQVFAVTPEGTVPFTTEAVTEKAELKQSSVRATSQVGLLRKIRRESTLELSFTAEPLDGTKQLKTVSGRVPLGRLTGLTLSTRRELVLEKTAPAPGLLPTLGGGPSAEQPLAGFELGRVSVKEVVVKDLDQSGRPKTLEVEFRAVVRNSITQEPVLDQAFQVREGETKQVIKTDDEEGALRWKTTYDFDFYKKQEPEKHEFTVQGSKYFGSAVVKRNVYLNLWEYEAPGAVAIDEEKDGAPSPSVVTTQGAGAELTLSSVMANFLERSFEVDSLLNLATTRTYRFEIAPEIRRLSRNKGWLTPTGLGNGRFRARFLLETSDRENPTVIDAKEVEVEARNGKIVVNVPFRVNDLRLVSVRNSLTVQILPLEERSSLVSPPYRATFDMVAGMSMRTELRKGEISARMGLAPRGPTGAPAEGAALFARAKGLEVLEAARLQALGISEADLSRFATTGFASSVGKLCGLFFEENGYNPFSQYKRCVRDPSGWLVMAGTEHVRKVLAAKMIGAPESTSLSISAGLNFSDSDSTSESTSKSTSVGWDVGAKGNVPGLSLVGIDIGIGMSVGQNWSTSTSWSRSRSKGTGRGYDEGKSLNADEIRFSVDAEVDHCTVVAKAGAPANSKRYFFCAGKSERKKFTEQYYHIAQSIRSGAVQDEGSALPERPLLALIRGTARYNQFKKVLQDPELSLNMTKDLPVPAEILKQSEQRFDGFFPGLLTP